MIKAVPHVLIIGATSAIAGALAERYAQRGCRLHLIGRNPDKLAHLSARLGQGEVSSETADFSDHSNNERLVERAIQDLGHIDLVFIVHGLLGDQLETERDFRAAEAVITANFSSAVSFLIPLANYFETQGSGKLVAISSVAGERGRPRNYTYGAAKSALTCYLQGVRSRLWPNVGVYTIKLGPVDTPMSATHAKNALFITREQAATDIIRAVERGIPEAFVPWYWSPIMLTVRHVPERLFQKLRFLSGR